MTTRVKHCDIGRSSSDNDFVTIIELPEGKHEYKFLIDGRWEYDLNEVC